MPCLVFDIWAEIMNGKEAYKTVRPVAYIPMNEESIAITEMPANTKYPSYPTSGTVPSGTGGVTTVRIGTDTSANDQYAGSPIVFGTDPAGLIGVQRAISQSADGPGYTTLTLGTLPAVATTNTTWTLGGNINTLALGGEAMGAGGFLYSSVTTTGPATGLTFPSGSEVAVLDTAHGLVTGNFITFSGVDGQGATLNTKTFVVTKTDDDNFTLDGTDGDDYVGAAVTAGTWTRTGYLLYGSPTHGDNGPSAPYENGATLGCIKLDGTGGIDFGSAIENDDGLSSGLVSRDSANYSNGLLAGIWFRYENLADWPSSGTSHVLFASPSANTPKWMFRLEVGNTAGTYWVKATSCPDSANTSDDVTLNLTGATTQWCFAGMAVQSSKSPGEMRVLFVNGENNQMTSADATSVPNWSIFGLGTTVNTKSTIGYAYASSAAGSFFKGYLANFFLVGLETTGGLALNSWPFSIDTWFRDFYVTTRGGPKGRTGPVQRRSMYSVQNLRV